MLFRSPPSLAARGAENRVRGGHSRSSRSNRRAEGVVGLRSRLPALRSLAGCAAAVGWPPLAAAAAPDNVGPSAQSGALSASAPPLRGASDCTVAEGRSAHRRQRVRTPTTSTLCHRSSAGTARAFSKISGGRTEKNRAIPHAICWAVRIAGGRSGPLTASNRFSGRSASVVGVRLAMQDPRSDADQSLSGAGCGR